MNGMTHSIFPAKRLGRLMKWPRFCALLGLLLARAALGTDALYENDAIITYPGTVSYPPVIDATNFVNTGTFSINDLSEPYETWNTINYTNIGYGLMSSDVGFVFDTQTTGGSHLMAGSFYNANEVDCGYYFVAWATNIMNPGTVNVPGIFTTVNLGTGATGVVGLMQFTGQKVDLSRSTLISAGGQGFAQAVGLYGLTGADTNSDWDATIDLGPTYAYPAWPVSFLPPPPNGFGFPNLPLNTTPYFNFAGVGTNLTIIRSVFIQDASPNVSYYVYFDSANLGFGGGNVTVEWRGGYVDLATGNPATNYLYLNDNYIESVATNDVIFNGIPENFSFTESPTPQIFLTPTAPGFFNVFSSGFVSNRFAYVSAQLIATSAGTNSIPNGAITNLPSRIQISASNELNLALAQIIQPDYLSLQSPHQFDGNTGAQIAAPFSDLNLGVTNGYLAITNLLPQSFPVWCGTVQAWSTRWLVTVTNIIGTNAVVGTNDYRVLLVASQLTPTLAAQVQNLILHATDSVIISDAFNVMRTLSIDAQSLTLTTNVPGNGATSADGELNLESPNIFWASSLPNLHWLTNNGAISTLNLANFGSGNTPTYTTNTTPAIAATGTLFEMNSGANVPATNGVTIGTYTYTFVNTITNTAPSQVKIAATFDGSMSNLIAAINHAAGSGTSYSTNTMTNTLVTAGLLTNHSFAVTARTAGSSGNSIVTTSSTSFLNWNGLLSTTLSGGVDAAMNVVMAGGPYVAFVNRGRVINLGGSTIWAQDFENYGTFYSGSGSFILQSLTTTLTNGSIIAGGDVSITTGSLVASNLVLQAGRSLTLQVTNQLTDTGVTNGNTWSVGGGSLVGLNLPILPNLPNNPANRSDLLGTTIFMMAPTPNKQVVSTWAATDYGVSTAGYTNNVAIGRLFLDGLGLNSSFKFTGTGTSNAMYVDYLELRDQATNRDASGSNFTALAISPNMVIYYAQAVIDGVSIAEKMDHKNSGHLRWVPQYAGYFSSTNIVYPDGTTNGPFNAALAQSLDIDSNGNGIANGNDPAPFFVSSEVNFTPTLTNRPPPSVRLEWTTVPLATNYIYYRTNLLSPNWLPLTSFNNYYYSANVAVTNSAHANSFVSPQPYPSSATNVWVFDVVTNVPHFYRVMVQPCLTCP
jgi:hypothetical protein